MRSRGEPRLVPWKTNFTEISYTPDIARFEMSSIDNEHIEMMRRRCIDLAACNPKLKISFNNTKYAFKDFSSYCKLYVDNIIYESKGRWSVGIAPADGSLKQTSFVNSVETRDGGTHVDHVSQQIIEWIREKIRKKHKIELRPSELRNHFFFFVQADIVNPAFSSQTKEKLITEARDFGSKFEASDAMLKAVFESEITQRILDWATQKNLADERKQLRELNKNLSKDKVPNLIDAKARTFRNQCSLALFEGQSAQSAFRKFRDPQTQGSFPLRGKFLNVSEMPSSKVIQNK